MMSRKADPSNVHYLPVGLTNFQKDLIEILISLHAKSFLNELDPNEVEKLLKLEPESSTDIKSEQNSTVSHHNYPNLSSRQLTYMFNTHIRAVANHPCLLVDHYMPRQFLRMEPTERLISSSDKFQKLQSLLTILVNKRKPNDKNLKIALIAHSIKELDLLEGLVLGRDYKIKRISGTSLYDEKHDFFKDLEVKNKYNNLKYKIQPSVKESNGTSNHSSTEESSKDSTPSYPNLNGNNSAFLSTSSTSNTYSGYPRDDYDYSEKRNSKKRKIDNRNWLFLTTTTHLMHEENLLHQYSIDLVISFDPLLDPKLPAIENINKSHYQYTTGDEQITQKIRNQFTVPIIKLLVKDTPDHYILQNGLDTETDSMKEYQNIKIAIDHFLRTINYKQDFKISEIDFDGFLTELLNTNDVNTTNADTFDNIQLTEATSLKNDDSIEYLKPKFCETIYPHSNLQISTNDFNVKSYQTELMKKTLSRLNDINEKLLQNKDVLLEKKLNETERQNGIDDLKGEIGHVFKKKEDLEKTKVDNEKRFERINNESIKLKDKLAQLKESQDELDNLLASIANLSTDNENELQSKINEYKSMVDTRTETLSKLNEHNEESGKFNDDLRTKYQQDSTNAANQSSMLTALQISNGTLKKEKEDTIGLSLNLKSYEIQENKSKEELELIMNKRNFLQGYIDKMTKTYKLNNNGNESNNRGNTPGGSEESNSRHRSTRSSAPTYT